MQIRDDKTAHDNDPNARELGGKMKRTSKMRIGESRWCASSLNATHFRSADDCDAGAGDRRQNYSPIDCGNAVDLFSNSSAKLS
jgi:hypothetical protein